MGNANAYSDWFYYNIASYDQVTRLGLTKDEVIYYLHLASAWGLLEEEDIRQELALVDHVYIFEKLKRREVIVKILAFYIAAWLIRVKVLPHVVHLVKCAENPAYFDQGLQIWEPSEPEITAGEFLLLDHPKLNEYYRYLVFLEYWSELSQLQAAEHLETYVRQMRHYEALLNDLVPEG